VLVCSGRVCVPPFSDVLACIPGCKGSLQALHSIPLLEGRVSVLRNTPPRSTEETQPTNRSHRQSSCEFGVENDGRISENLRRKLLTQELRCLTKKCATESSSALGKGCWVSVDRIVTRSARSGRRQTCTAASERERDTGPFFRSFAGNGFSCVPQESKRLIWIVRKPLWLFFCRLPTF
jgi:hypothetical protein